MFNKPWPPQHDHRVDEKSANRESELGFVLNTQFNGFGQLMSRRIYQDNQQECPTCNLFRNIRDFAYGKQWECKQCRDRRPACE